MNYALHKVNFVSYLLDIHELALALHTKLMEPSMEGIVGIEIKEQDILINQDYANDDQIEEPLTAPNLNYAYAATVQENTDEEDDPTYCVAFAYRPNKYKMSKPGTWITQLNKKGVQLKQGNNLNDFGRPGQPFTSLPSSIWKNLFATANGRTVRVYHIEHGEAPELLVAFRDPDDSEIFFSCTWTYNVDGRRRWWVLAAGERGVVRVMDVNQRQVVRTLIGHGNSINDLAVHPNDPALLLSASKDESIRMWNLRTGATVVVFAGVKGHRGEVVAVDFNRQGHLFASCGIDNSIRIWNLVDDTEFRQAIAKSHEIAEFGTNDCYYYWDTKEKVKKRLTILSRMFPVFITRKLHKNYVDCIRFAGDTLISKSIHNRLLLAKPRISPESPTRPSSEYTVLREVPLNGCDVWFIRFGVDRARRIIAIGNEQSGIDVFNLDSQLHEEYPEKNRIQVPHSGASENCYVRKCAFSEDASIIVSVDDIGRVIIYERRD